MAEFVMNSDTLQKLIIQTEKVISDMEAKLETLKQTNTQLLKTIDDPVTGDCKKMMDKLSQSIRVLKEDVIQENKQKIEQIKKHYDLGHQGV